MSLGALREYPNNTVEILPATDDAVKEYGSRFGAELVKLTPAHIEALQAGKMLAWHDSEYSTFVIFEE